MKDTLEALVIEELALLDYDLVDFRRAGSRSRPVFEVRIDRRDGTKVTVDDCARASRALEARLETSGGLGETRYVLEVSSPGMERPLRRVAEWRRFIGRSAMVKAPSLGGRVEVAIVGVDGSEGEEIITVRDAQGTEHQVPFAEVAEARLVVHWK
jgi:ribosome maturation factor RimP